MTTTSTPDAWTDADTAAFVARVLVALDEAAADPDDAEFAEMAQDEARTLRETPTDEQAEASAGWLVQDADIDPATLAPLPPSSWLREVPA